MLRGDTRVQIRAQATKAALQPLQPLQPLTSDSERADKRGLFEFEQSNHDATRRNMFCLQVGVGIVSAVLVALSAVAVGMIGGVSSDLHALTKMAKQNTEFALALQQQVNNMDSTLSPLHTQLQNLEADMFTILHQVKDVVENIGKFLIPVPPHPPTSPPSTT